MSVVVVITGAKRAPQGTEFTVERFGRYAHTLVKVVVERVRPPVML